MRVNPAFSRIERHTDWNGVLARALSSSSRIATVGDFLDKPLDKGGPELSRPIASAALAAVILILILVLPQRRGQHPGQGEARA
jgi:uncharacterized membrane-anchored protein